MQRSVAPVGPLQQPPHTVVVVNEPEAEEPPWDYVYVFMGLLVCIVMTPTLICFAFCCVSEERIRLGSFKRGVASAHYIFATSSTIAGFAWFFRNCKPSCDYWDVDWYGTSYVAQLKTDDTCVGWCVAKLFLFLVGAAITYFSGNDYLKAAIDTMNPPRVGIEPQTAPPRSQNMDSAQGLPQYSS
ncbi:hypothetical protein BCR33DRAFT_720803 [Rhizoclosmatium globosum]|uniref:Uncharacterized protein n=1 Tax=Rhizoclosmatium globosum TaxID=329046 RepID=A0A1Y2BWC6_9FUNG|nr:hypothetical protein BCR33DRAFT_720803 [Rhizoclosmatium globosum]|eukprot:ORY38435.1 hypothetical protein BCR33DRAFT_720803 [Rhizoclosmatium globosum]